MSESNNGVTVNLDVLGVKDLSLKLLSPAAEAAGKTLQDAWELVFGGFGNYVEKKRITRRNALEDFKASLEDKVNNIPEEQLCEPLLSIVGPTLEASKYYFEEEAIREMFASTISASMDSRKAFRVHPSFPTIIQQMSTLDAQNLECFYLANGSLPLCEYLLKERDGKNDNYPYALPYRRILTNVFLSNPKVSSLEQGAASITSLLRLGLITIDYDVTIGTAEEYIVFAETPEYCALLNKYKNDKDQFPYIQKGSAELTPLGENLCAICFSAGNL